MFSADDVQRILQAAITQIKAGDEPTAERIATALTPIVTPALHALTDDGPLMTAQEALFVRDAVAEELNANGGTDIAERLLKAGYIDVVPILDAHRNAPRSTPATIGALTGPIPVPPAAPSPFVPLPASVA